MMKQRILIAGWTVIAAAMLNGCMSLKTTVQPSWHAHPSHRIAVLPFKGDAPYSENLSEFLVTELVDRGFTVVERFELIRVIDEHSLQYSGAFDPSTLIANGKLAGVDYIVLGSVSTRRVVPLMEWLLGAGNSVTQVDAVHIRWVSVRNGQIVASSRIRNSRGGRVETIAARIAESMDGAIRTVTAPRDERYAAVGLAN